jgi:hypothetical protein
VGRLQWHQQRISNSGGASSGGAGSVGKEKKNKTETQNKITYF